MLATIVMHSKKNCNNNYRNPSVHRSGRGTYRQNNHGSRNRGRGCIPQNKHTCQLCDKSGHVVQKCYIASTFPLQEFNSSHMIQDIHQELIVLFNWCSSWWLESYGCYSTGIYWWKLLFPNSGTTNHVTKDLSNVSISSKYIGSKIYMGKGIGHRISHIGHSSFLSNSQVCISKNFFVFPLSLKISFLFLNSMLTMMFPLDFTLAPVLLRIE